MEAHKDITEMSFEEFFADSKVKSEKKELKERAPDPAADIQQEKPRQKEEMGFFGAGPKVNYTAGRFQLYVPRFTGGENDQFNTAIDCEAGVIPLARLEYTKHKDTRTTRPATLDLTSAGVSPMERFSLTIDGEVVFTNKPRDIMFFNNIGIPVAKPAGDTFVVHSPLTSLKLVKCEEISPAEIRDGLIVEHLQVSMAGGVWIDDTPYEGDAEDPTARAAVSEPVPEDKPEEPKPKPKKKAAGRIKGTLTLSEPVKDADIICDGVTYPMYAGPFSATVDAGARDVSQFFIHVRNASGDILKPTPADPAMRIDTGDAFGPAEVIFEKEDGKVLAKEDVFLLPGFACSYEGKGDIVEHPAVEYTMFGETAVKDLTQDGAYGPFEKDGTTFFVDWIVPVVTYDIGAGMVPYSECEVDIGDMTADYLRVSVKGARKKSLFFGRKTGKKINLTPEWDGETCEVDMDIIRDEVYQDSGSHEYYLFISVNSFPNRRFMTIRNPPMMEVSFADGQITAEIQPNAARCVCRLYRTDKSAEEFELSAGTNTVPVDADVVEAEVTESSGDKVRMCIPVKVRPLPFLLKDDTGDYWLYVSKDKRIPLPDELIVGGKPQYQTIRAWHDRIVRMNPELRDVTYAMMQDAFKVLEE